MHPGATINLLLDGGFLPLTSRVDSLQPAPDELATALASLLGAKTRAGYGYQPVNKEARVRSARATEKLLRAARDRYA